MKRTLAAVAALTLGCSGQLPLRAAPAVSGARPIALVITEIQGDVGDKTRAELMSELTALDQALGGTPFGTRDAGVPLRCWGAREPGTLIRRCDAEAQALGGALGADAVVWGRVVGKNSGLFQLYWSLPAESARTFRPAGGERQSLSWADFAPLLGDVLLVRATRGPILDAAELTAFAARIESTLHDGAPRGFTARVRGELGLLRADALLAVALQASHDTDRDRAVQSLERARAAYRSAIDTLGLGATADLRAASRSALGRAAEELARLTGDTATFREAIDAYDRAASAYDRNTSKPEWETAQTHAANLELELGQRLGDAQLILHAVRRNRDIVAAERGADRGAALNNLCAALTTLATARQNEDAFEAAVTACHDANDAIDRAERPLLWAAARRNLGNALSALASFAPGGDELQRAVEAYSDARAVYAGTKQRFDWADASLALGSAQASLGARNSDAATLEAALAAFADAETVHSQQADAETWAMIEGNRAETLYLLGKLRDDPELLGRSASALEELAKGTLRSAHPLEWARIEHNLGSVLGTLGERTQAPDVLRRALGALRAALEVRTRATARDEWAASELALGQYAHSLGQLTGDAQAHHEAVTALKAAFTVYVEDPKSMGWARAAIALASSLGALGTSQTSDAGSLLEEAATLAEHVADVTRTTLPEASADAELVEGEALRAQLPDAPARTRATTDVACRALAAYLSGWSVAVDHEPSASHRAEDRIRTLLGFSRAGRDCRLPHDAWTRFQRDVLSGK